MNVYSAGCRVKYIGGGLIGADGLTIGRIYQVVGQENNLLYLLGEGTYPVSCFQIHEGTYHKDGIITTAVAPEVPVESTGFKDPRPYQSSLSITKEEVII